MPLVLLSNVTGSMMPPCSTAPPSPRPSSVSALKRNNPAAALLQSYSNRSAPSTELIFTSNFLQSPLVLVSLQTQLHHSSPTDRTHRTPLFHSPQAENRQPNPTPSSPCLSFNRYRHLPPSSNPELIHHLTITAEPSNHISPLEPIPKPTCSFSSLTTHLLSFSFCLEPSDSLK
ncbi:hypothetical protein AAC387_Pa09g1570 [Persea americana]|eukprot:TRINITY_DN21085_c0_g1_i1.p1 TRINITY_DN21085_c0_g1~~TRINITY_DN21085_c0_g1_i1.p1  ORF type:complete len:174 (+),score=23.07 TRINITY_DN21085_c0_g1_i1:111-632(+)